MNIAHHIATLGPIGRTLPAPGSWGSLVALVSGYVIASYGFVAIAAATILVTMVGFWACEVYGRDTGKKDASEVIIDEVAGMWSVLLVTPLTLEGYVAAFLAFRLFDITKPFPVNKAEAIPGGAGVMADDLVAGGIAGLVMLVLLQYGIITWPAP